MSPAIPRATSWPRCIAGSGPSIAVPVHGELRHHWPMPSWRKIAAGAAGRRARNGQMLRLAPGRAEIIDEMPSGRMHLDGRVLVAEGEGLAKDRRAMAFAGMIAVTLVLDDKGRVAAPPTCWRRHPEPVHEAVRKAVDEALDGNKRSDPTICARMSAAPRAAPPRMPGARSRSPACW